MTVSGKAHGVVAGGRVEAKVAIVTGAGQSDGPGIGTGKATAILLARNGASVVLLDRERARAEATSKEIESEGGRSFVVEGDVTSPEDCERTVRAAEEEFGGLDVLVNNVGVSIAGSVSEMPEDIWDSQIDVNLKSVYLMSKHAVPVMAGRGGGSIINISSVAALHGIGFAAYSAAKGGMISLSRDMAVQYGRQGIRVNVVVPGNILTPIAMSAAAQLGKEARLVTDIARAVLPLGETASGDGWDIAFAVLFFASDESKWITGQTLAADGGADATTPPVAAAQALPILKGLARDS